LENTICGFDGTELVFVPGVIEDDEPPTIDQF
jgi:hypothetical protein